MKILSHKGFKNFSGILNQGLSKDILDITFADDSKISATKSHKFLVDGIWLDAILLDVGDVINGKLIKNISDGDDRTVYDMLHVEEAHSYYSSGVYSHNCNFLYIDECAFVENWDAFYTSVYPTIASGRDTKVVFTSCVPKNTLVYTTNGLKYIGEFVDDSRPDGFGYYVPEYTVQGHSKVRTSNIIHNDGHKPTRIIKTKSGEIESTHTHKFWAYKQNGGYGKWRADELDIGDFLSTHSKYDLWGDWVDCSDFVPTQSKSIKNIFNPNKLTPDICYLLGLYIAEGNVVLTKSASKNEIISATYVITCGDDVSEIFNKLDIKYSCLDGLHYTFSNKNLMEFMQYLGFDLKQKAKTKTIPSKLLTTTKENIAALLRGMFDGDGCITTKNGQSKISYTTTSKELIKQVKMLLLNFGIFSSVYDRECAPTERSKVWSYPQSIELNTRDSIKFCELIGFGLERKRNRIKLDTKLRNGSPSDIVPNSYNILKECGAKVFINMHIPKKPDISRHKLLELKEKIEKNNYYNSDRLREFFHDNVSENIRWEIIKDITESENRVYDVSLPESDDKFCHSVVYNGFIGYQTPNGLNHYYKLWQDAVEGKSAFIPIKVTWKDVPGRDEQWKLQTISNTSKEAFIQEHEAEFVGSSGTLIDSSYLKELREWTPIKANKYTRVYEAPIKDAMYVICADVSRGKGIDNSAFLVINVSTLPYKIVATYCCDTIPPDMFAEVIYQAHINYNQALVLVENNDAGVETIRVLHDTYECETILGTIPTLNQTGEKRKLSINGTFGFEMGIRTTKSTKAIGCSRLKTLIENYTVEFGDKYLIYELNRFVRKNSSYEAEEGAHDDLVMCFVIFSWLTTQDLFADLVNINTRDLIRQKFENRFEEELVPFGYIVDGINEYDEDFEEFQSIGLPTYEEDFFQDILNNGEDKGFVLP